MLFATEIYGYLSYLELQCRSQCLCKSISVYGSPCSLWYFIGGKLHEDDDNYDEEEDAYDDINLCVFCRVGICSGALIDYFLCVAFVLLRPAALLLYQHNNHALLSASCQVSASRC